MDVCPELRRKLHERAFDEITEARQKAGKMTMMKKKKTTTTDHHRGIISETDGGNGDPTTVRISEVATGRTPLLKSPKPAVGAKPSMVALKEQKAVTSDGSTSAASATETKSPSIAARSAISAATSIQTLHSKQKIKNKKKSQPEPGPVLSRAKKLGKTMGAEPKSAFRSIYDMHEDEKAERFNHIRSGAPRPAV